MLMEDIASMKPADPLVVSPEVFQQLGSITRLLHDTMRQLGVMPKLQIATDGLPDARSRLATSPPFLDEPFPIFLRERHRANHDRRQRAGKPGGSSRGYHSGSWWSGPTTSQSQRSSR